MLYNNVELLAMKKVLYLTEWELKSSDGISKKINSQLRSMEKKAHVTLCVINGKKVNIGKKTNYTKSIFHSYFLLYQYVKYNPIDSLYARNMGGIGAVLFIFLTNFLKIDKVFVEVPTYPFKGEGKWSIKTALLGLVKKCYRFSVDSVVYIGEHTSKIWGIPAIRIDNGIDVDDYRPVIDKDRNSPIHMVGVASLAHWHGYDRLILGINESEIPCVFHIVGEGPELEYLKQLVEPNRKDNVVFHGYKDGCDLDTIFDVCHIAIDSLGRHRSGISVNSSLKSKEYAARGLPFILSHVDSCFESCEFAYKVDANDSPIPISSVIDWYNRLESSTHDIRAFAKSKLTWDEQIEKIGI